jgi:RNA polymerase sigma-70 factor (ECF subfamily)
MILKLLQTVVDHMKPNRTSEPAGSDITALLQKGGERDAQSEDRLATELFPELKKIANAHMRRERSDHTLQPTALVSELYVHLLKQPGFNWTDRNHFLLAASQAMHRYLVDYARAKRSQKRGGGWQRTEAEVSDKAVGKSVIEVLEIDELLTSLRKEEPRMASVVEMKFFGGLTFAEIGGVLGVDERTAKRDWTLARAWLRARLGGGEPDDVSGRMGKD